MTNPNKLPNFVWIDSLKVVKMDVTTALSFPEQLKNLAICDSTIHLDAPIIWNVESLSLTDVELKLTKVNPDMKILLP